MKLPCDCGQHGFTRRHFLFGAASAAQYLALTRRVEAQTSGGGAPKSTASACIFVNLQGAPAHLDTFDAKDGPWNPPGADLRSYSGGVTLSRLLFPNLSKITADLLMLHSVQAWENGHDRGQFYVQTGRALNPAFAAEIPHAGAIIAAEKGSATLPLPPFMAFDDPAVHGATFLGGRFEPFQPAANRDGLGLLTPAYFNSSTEFDKRNSLLAALDAPQRNNPASDDVKTYADFYSAARNMMFNDPISGVFRFSTQDEQRYGNSNLGRDLLVARNAVRARSGTAFVSVAHTGWDQHYLAFDRGNGSNYYRLTGEVDTALYNLVEDLRSTGDLARTLIVLMGEFGRTPGPLNPRGGRDHYKDVMSVLLIGGGVKGGRAIGASNADGSKIADPGWSAQRPIQTEDIMATIYSALGIDWTKSLISNTNRRWQYVTGASEGLYQPINEVFG
jgi:uncharacterized protein (DUF1501 family)